MTSLKDVKNKVVFENLKDKSQEYLETTLLACFVADMRNDKHTMEGWFGKEVKKVVAQQKAKQDGTTRPNDEERDEDDSYENFSRRSRRMTAHVENANRVCCALTHGRSCVIVLAQLGGLLHRGKSKQTKTRAAVSAMPQDFMDRDLVYHDCNSLDTGEAGVKSRAQCDAARYGLEAQRQKASKS